MNPGSHAFAATIDDTPASRSSLTIRSCNVPNARVMRPFACGLLAQMMSMFSANSARPNWVTPSPPAASLRFTRKSRACRCTMPPACRAVPDRPGLSWFEWMMRRAGCCRCGSSPRRAPSRRSAPVRPGNHAAGAADAARGDDADGPATVHRRSSNRARSRATPNSHGGAPGLRRGRLSGAAGGAAAATLPERRARPAADRAGTDAAALLTAAGEPSRPKTCRAASASFCRRIPPAKSPQPPHSIPRGRRKPGLFQRFLNGGWTPSAIKSFLDVSG
jgi:hypothetical protein